MSLSQPVEDIFLIFDYRDCDHPMRLDDRDLSQHSQATFPRQTGTEWAASNEEPAQSITYDHWSNRESGLSNKPPSQQRALRVLVSWWFVFTSFPVHLYGRLQAQKLRERLPYGGMPEFQSGGEEAFIRQEEASGEDGTLLYISYLERSP